MDTMVYLGGYHFYTRPLTSTHSSRKKSLHEYLSSKIAGFFHHLVLALKTDKNDLSLKYQAIFEEKDHMQNILQWVDGG